MNKRLLGSAHDYLDLVRALVLVVDPTGRVEFANKWLCFLLGYSKKEMIGEDWFENFIPGETKKKQLREFKKFISENVIAAKKREYYVQSKDGDIMLVEWHDTLLKDKDGSALGVLSSGEDITEKYILRHHLAEQQVQGRKELMQAVLEAAEVERRQIAFELHDGVNQVLTVCKLMLENEMMVHNSAGMKKIAKQLQQTINDIRMLSHQLSPADMGNEVLYAAVKDLIKQTNATGNLFINLKLVGARYLKELPQAIALNLYRIIQEALNNILKHAKATEVKIDLQGSTKSVDLEIWDDGKGFQRKSIAGGLGLKTIYTRAEAAGGKAYIASAPGEGTLLSVHIPLGV